jgi:subtilisin family serine protease
VFLVAAWMVVATSVAAVIAVRRTDVAAAAGLFVPAGITIAMAAGTGVAVLLPIVALRLALRRRAANFPASAVAGRVWLLAATVATGLGLVRAIPLSQNLILLAATATVAATMGFVVRRLPGGGSPTLHGSPSPAATAAFTGMLPATTAGVLMLAPWLALGALGGLTESLLAVLAAASLGYLVTGIVSPDVFSDHGFARPSRQVLVGGLTFGVALVPITAAVGGTSVNMAELTTVPALGFVVSAIFFAGRSTRRTGARRRPSWLGVLLAFAFVGPLALVDPAETSSVLGPGDVGTWTTTAAEYGLVVAFVLGLVYAFGLPSSTLRKVEVGVTAAAIFAAVGLYVGPGHPGFFGDRLFVVMSDQADLTGLSSISDRTVRLTATYHRLVDTANRAQAPLRHLLDELHIAYTPYYLVNGILVDAGAELRPLLSAQSGVDRVLYDQRLRPLPAPVPAVTGDLGSYDAGPVNSIAEIGATKVWADGDTGQGITIGSSDTGVDGAHPDLRAGFRGGDDSWYDPWNGTRTPTDHVGHGTHTLGIAVGRNGIGVAPGARWMGCVDLDRAYGSPSGYLSCLQFMLAPFPYGGNPFTDGRPDDAAEVLTNSWGCVPIEGCDPDTFRPATNALAAAGIYVVASAGNSGPACGTIVDPPAVDPNVMTVGAVDLTVSSRGPTPQGLTKPDLLAPGHAIYSAMPGGTFGLMSGTSMAAPHVAGVVALMWAANPRLIGDIADTTRILEGTADKPVTAGDNAPPACGSALDSNGAGVVDADRAVTAARAFE